MYVSPARLSYNFILRDPDTSLIWLAEKGSNKIGDIICYQLFNGGCIKGCYINVSYICYIAKGFISKLTKHTSDSNKIRNIVKRCVCGKPPAPP